MPSRVTLAVAALIFAVALAGCGGDDDAPVASPTPLTATATPGSTSTPTAAATPTRIATATGTAAGTATPSATATLTATESATRSATPTATATPSATIVLTPASCAELNGLEVGEARVLATSVVAAAGDVPEFCKVNGRIGAALDFELRLPATWNEKAVFLGGGGFDGSIPTPDASGPAGGLLQRGFASIATDSGHKGSAFDGAWALNDEEAVHNFAELAWHRVLAAAREIIVRRYATAIRRTYFEGGSSGGREALIQAQRWPEDYDGVIAREPALSFTSLILAGNRIVKRLFATPGAALSPAAVDVYSRAVLGACDALDGVEDAIVANVAACHFDAASLLCDTPAADCLTQDEIASIDTLHSDLQLDFSLANGVNRFPGYVVSGAESEPGGWPLWLTGFTPDVPSSLVFALQDQFIKYFVTDDPQANSLAFSPDDARQRLQSLSALLDATDANLSAFTGRGGKLILWHGWADSAISAYSTVDYYQHVVDTAGGQEQADAFVRFYTSAGVDHTGGGNGAPTFDLLGPLDAWVENGDGPGDLVAYKRLGGVLTPFRPLCRYPAFPRYQSGDANAAASFACHES